MRVKNVGKWFWGSTRSFVVNSNQSLGFLFLMLKLHRRCPRAEGTGGELAVFMEDEPLIAGSEGWHTSIWAISSTLSCHLAPDSSWKMDYLLAIFFSVCNIRVCKARLVRRSSHYWGTTPLPDHKPTREYVGGDSIVHGRALPEYSLAREYLRARVKWRTLYFNNYCQLPLEALCGLPLHTDTWDGRGKRGVGGRILLNHPTGYWAWLQLILALS